MRLTRKKVLPRWTDDEVARLEASFTAGHSWKVMALQAGHSEGACRTKLSELRKHRPIKLRIRREKWTASQIETLLVMVTTAKREGKRPGWNAASAATGHHESSCRLKYNAICAREGDLKLREEIDRKIAAREAQSALKVSAEQVPIKARVGNPDFSRGGSTMKFLVDAEIRNRIAEQGVTAGLLGDPMPGRSALDKHRAGIPDEYPLTDYRKAYELRRPKITLPEVPFG